MQRATASFLLAVLLTPLSTSAEEAETPRPLRRIPKAFVTLDEIANPDLYYPRYDAVYQPPPSLQPPPPAGVVRPGEFDQMDAQIIAMVNYGGAYYQMWAEMVSVYANAGHVWIIHAPGTQALVEPLIGEEGVDAASYSWLNYPINSIWIRDYGPEFVVEPDGTRHVIDAAYHADRPLDDAIPLWIGASDWLNTDGTELAVHGHDHGLNGGNVMTDGAGTCFFSDILYGYEMPTGWTAQDVDALFADYLGCEQIVTLKPICHDGTGHIDLYAKAVGPTSILLAEFAADTHFDGTVYEESTGHCGSNYPNDYQDQEDNLATLEAVTNLEGDPFVVTRLPMPEPYLQGGYWVYRSYMNSEVANGWVAMPSYYEPQGDEESAQDLLDLEAEAIAAYETALPGAEVVPIDSDHIIPLAGAIHCITHEIPAQEGWEPPAEYCGDGVVTAGLGEACDGALGADETCEELGLEAGTLACDQHCEIDTSGCGDADTDTDTDTDADGDADPDASPDGADGDGSNGDADCGCRAAGEGAAPGLAAVLRALLG